MSTKSIVKFKQFRKENLPFPIPNFKAFEASKEETFHTFPNSSFGSFHSNEKNSRRSSAISGSYRSTIDPIKFNIFTPPGSSGNGTPTAQSEASFVVVQFNEFRDPKSDSYIQKKAKKATTLI